MERTKQPRIEVEERRATLLGGYNAPLPGSARTRISPPLALGLLIALVGMALISASRDNAQEAPSTGKATPVINTSPRTPRTSTPTVTVEALTAAPTPRQSLAFYTGDVRASMFSEPQAPEPPPAPAPPTLKIQGEEGNFPVLAVMPVDPFADWSYTGTATIGDTVVAILENTKTKDAQFVHVGDSFIDAKVTSIGAQRVTLQAAGRSRVLAMSTNFRATPLDNNAAYLNPQPQQGQNDQLPPGATPPQPDPNAANPNMNRRRGNRNVDPNAKFTLPNGSQLNGADAQRYQRKLNRNFNDIGGN